MSHQLLLSIRDAMVIYKEKPVFENLDLNIHKGLRTALIGKNGAGKSTIMKIIFGIKALDEGEQWVEPGISIGCLLYTSPSPRDLSTSRMPSSA